MAIERYGSKTDVAVKLVLVFFVCLLSFSIGTFVGKKFSDNQHKLAKFEPEAAISSDVAATTTGEPRSKAMTDEEFAKLAEEFVAEDEGTRAPAATAADAKKEEPAKKEGAVAAKKDTPSAVPAAKKDASAPAVAAKKDDHGVLKPSTVADRVAKNQKVVAKSETGSRIPAALPKEIGSSAIGKYTVQVGSYPTENEAKKMTESLKEQTFSAFYVEAKVKDKIWYRVSVGLFNTQKEAEAYMKDLLERKKVSSAIVQRISK